MKVNETGETKKKVDDGTICIREVNENIRRAELGQPLTKPLRELNFYCDFKKKFNQADKRIRGLYNEVDKIKRAKYYRKYKEEYNKRPEVKAKKREYCKKYCRRPEVIAKKREYLKEYYKRPEVIAKRKAYSKKYYSKPEVKARQKEYDKRPEVKARRKEYYKRPEVKAKAKEDYKKRVQKKLQKEIQKSKFKTKVIRIWAGETEYKGK